jgi:hypothetical protein
MKKNDLDSIMNHIATTALEMGPKDEWEPRIFLVDKDGERTLMPIPGQFLATDETARVMFLLIATAIKKKKAVSCAFVSTSWRYGGVPNPGESANEAASRLVQTTEGEEMVVIAACDRDKAQVYLATVNRDGDHPELGKWEKVKGKANFGGIIETIIPALNSSREVN